MAHFAELDSDNKVLRTIVVNNDVILDENNVEQEQLGIDFCHQLYGSDTIWVQCSYNSNFRNIFPLPNYHYYFPTEDIFMPQKPYDYFVLEEFEYTFEGITQINRFWVPNVPYPDPTFATQYTWNNETTSWDLIIE